MDGARADLENFTILMHDQGMIAVNRGGQIHQALEQLMHGRDPAQILPPPDMGDALQGIINH